MAFSVDGRLLAVQGGGPDWLLVVWAWERAKAIGSMRTADSSSRPVCQVPYTRCIPGNTGYLPPCSCLTHPTVLAADSTLTAGDNS